MGVEESKFNLNTMSQDLLTTVQRNTQSTVRFANNDDTVKPNDGAPTPQVGPFILIIVRADTNDTLIRKEKKEIEIEGTTYEMVEFINRGGFGEIHKAKVKNKDIMVAIKVMANAPGLQEEVKNEIKFLRLVKQIPIAHHPIVEFYGSKVEKDGIYIAMELAQCDLGTFWIDRLTNGDPEENGVIGMIIIVYVLRALAFLEKLNIIHGDIKPQNIVIIPGEQCFYVKLIDFGTVEKMNTLRMQLTVAANKAHTLFFASPEFLKRDSKNLISRKLHKKSDAWAAGVLFHLFFCGGLPWKDQTDYEKFCNDPNSEDVVVPEDGGFRMIIELLLKKDPEERASAKETLMQLKAHPAIGNVIETLHTKFCPVDDVCTVKVPDGVRQGIAQLARAGHVAVGSGASSGTASSGAASRSTTSSGPRRSCRYGRNCNRDDAAHHKEYAHSGDADYRESEASADSSSEKPKCRYGAHCYRKDLDHRAKYLHPAGWDPDQSGPSQCRWGAGCTNHETSHRKKFSHPIDTSRTSKQTCRYGKGCTRRDDPNHMKTYLHN